MPKPELYISIDIETDGPAPGVNSMLSLGAAAFTPDTTLTQDKYGQVSSWYSTIFPLAESKANKETAEWWATQPEAWAEVNKDQIDAGLAMHLFCDWLSDLKDFKLIAAAWPASFDFAYVNHYLWRFTGKNPLGFACLDIRSLVMGLTKSPTYYNINEKATRKLAEVDKEGLMAHNALDDAIEQGRLLIGLLRNAR